MNSYSRVEDFAADETFQDYVLEKSENSVELWQQYILDNPEKLEVMDKASLFVKQFSPGNIIAIKKDFHYNKPTPLKKYKYLFLILTAVLLLSFSGYKYITYKLENKVFKTYIADSQQKKVVLEDESIVYLKPKSTISLIGNWDVKRVLSLDGEAYFDVQNDNNKSFEVHSGNRVVEVLGTEFSISNKESYSVLLQEGSVKVFDNKTNPKILRPNELLTINNDVVTIKKVDARSFNYWIGDKIAFKEKKLTEIVNILKRSYDLDIEIENKDISNKIISAQIPENNPTLLLTAIAEIYGISIINEQGKYTIK